MTDDNPIVLYQGTITDSGFDCDGRTFIYFDRHSLKEGILNLFSEPYVIVDCMMSDYHIGAILHLNDHSVTIHGTSEPLIFPHNITLTKTQ